MSSTYIQIGDRKIGPGYPVYTIAELSANHNHDYELAARTIEAAKIAGADAIKLQTYTPDTMTIPCDNEYFQLGEGTIWEGRNLYDLYGEAYTPWEWQPKLQKLAADIGIDFFSTAFDPTSVDFLEDMNVVLHKVASFEIVDIPLIEKIARTGKPMIISTGMATLKEIEEAVEAARNAGCGDLLLLKCTSAYPAPPEEMNLRSIPYLAEHFALPVGLSDHTLGVTVATTAVAFGACAVEKHFTLSRSTPGPDSSFSVEPREFKEMVENIKIAEQAIGEVSFADNIREKSSLVFRRSLFIVEDMAKGDLLTEDNLKIIRPGYGLAPKHIAQALGKRVKEDVKRGTPLSWEMMDG